MQQCIAHFQYFIAHMQYSIVFVRHFRVCPLWLFAEAPIVNVCPAENEDQRRVLTVMEPWILEIDRYIIVYELCYRYGG